MQDSTTLKLFGTGQITLPKKWRKQIDAKDFIAILDDDEITLKPIRIEWKNIFNAKKDGGSISGKALIKAIDKRYGQNK